MRANGFNALEPGDLPENWFDYEFLRGSAEEAYTTLIRCSKSEIPV